ncbi:MAG: ATP phosphoribosyltransferase regulatory subunit, partial [Candidatus Babeliales bacterium]
MFSRVKGTRDLLDLSLYNFIVTQAKKQLQKYNFIEIATPILEPIDLFKRSLGLHTDVVGKEMFTLEVGAEDKKETIVLRPEATASTVRAFIEAGIDQVPWKVFSVGPMFRHERPQKGRYRQFHQINMEIIGAASISQDAHFIKMLDRLFKDHLSLKDYALVINFLGCPEDRKKYREKLYAFLEKKSAKLCAPCLERKDANIMRVFDCKNPACQELYQKAPYIAAHLCVG